MNANVTMNSVHPGIVRTRLTREREGLLTGVVFVFSFDLFILPINLEEINIDK